MGAWGNGSFENDDAADFVNEITEGKDLTPVREIFDTVLGASDYLEATDASQAIAAAEIVAATLGHPTSAAQQEEELVGWVARVKPPADLGLAKKAAQVLDRILASNSELSELWEESDDFADWKAVVSGLRSHLQV